ncbi:MAG: SRPBCC family protein [Xanthomonadales bacterium]|nr:SRPBCC family protein [Xanthomonadales bacterium]
MAFIATPGWAEVVSVNQGGFALNYEQAVNAAPDEIYAAMTRIGEWWHPAHSWEGKAENLYMDMRIGGCFCEKLSNGGGVEHLRLVYFAPGKEIRLTGGLGPLQGMGMGGAMVWTITPGEESNTVRWTYTAHGHGDSIETLAPIVDSVQQQAFDRLLRYIETGSPETGD